MIISNKYKFIFIAIPKTGTSSVESVLNKFSTNKMQDTNKHYYLHQLTDFRVDDYFTFTFVRNPWQRHLSTYFYYIKMVKYWKQSSIKKSSDWYGVYKAYVKTLSECDTFSDWVHKLYCRKWLENSDWDPVQLSWAKEVDFVGRFENLQEDLNIICDKIGIPIQELPHKNKSKHKHYTEYYDDETRQIVAKKYAKDIEYFGYKFGE